MGLEHAAHIEYLGKLLATQVRVLTAALTLKQAGTYPNIIEQELSPILDALRATAMAGLSEQELAASLNSARLALVELGQDEAGVMALEEGRLLRAFAAFVLKLKPRSRKELLRFLEEPEEQMWGVLRCGSQPEVRTLYRVSEQVMEEFALGGKKDGSAG